MTNEKALLRLAEDTEDADALMALVENNEKILVETIGRYFQAETMREKARMTLLIRISRRAKYFLPEHDVADVWISMCTESECRRLRNEVVACTQPNYIGPMKWTENCTDRDEGCAFASLLAASE